MGAQLVRINAHNLVQAGRYHTRELLTGRCALCVQCMHMCTCAPNTERIPLYTVNLTFAFNNLMRRYAPNLDPVVYGVSMDSKEFGGLSDRHVLLRRLVLLCALCAVLSHTRDTRPLGPAAKALRSHPRASRGDSSAVHCLPLP